MIRPASAAIAAAAIAAAVAGCGAGTTYKAAVTGYSVVNPADLSVTVKVTNTGSAAGTPTCTISAHDDAYAYTGVDAVTLQDPVPAGAFRFFTDDITITSQGARYVTKATVACS